MADLQQYPLPNPGLPLGQQAVSPVAQTNPLMSMGSGIMAGGQLGLQKRQVDLQQAQQEAAIRAAQIQQQKNQEEFLTSAWGKIAELKNIPSYQKHLINAINPLTNQVMSRYGISLDLSHKDLTENDPAQEEVTKVMSSNLPGEEKATALKAIHLAYPSQEDLGNAINSMSQQLMEQSKVNYQKDPNTGQDIPVNPQGQPVGSPLGNSPSGLSPVARDNAMKFSQDLINRDSVKKATNGIDLMEHLKQAVIDNNPASRTNVKFELAQTAGIPAGRITSGEAGSEAGSKAGSAKLGRYVQNFIDGKLTQRDQEDFLDLLRSQTDATQKIIDENIKSTVGQFTKFHPEVPKQQAQDLIGGGLSSYMQPRTPVFVSVEQAQRANLPKGTKIKVGNRSATVH